MLVSQLLQSSLNMLGRRCIGGLTRRLTALRSEMASFPPRVTPEELEGLKVGDAVLLQREAEISPAQQCYFPPVHRFCAQHTKCACLWVKANLKLDGFWVNVTSVTDEQMTGVVANNLISCTAPGNFGDTISFKRDRISMICLLYTSPSPRDATLSRMPSSA